MPSLPAAADTCSPRPAPTNILPAVAPCPAQVNVTALAGPMNMEIGSGKMLAGAIDRLATLLQPLGVDPTYLQAISAKLMGGIGEWSTHHGPGLLQLQ